MNSKIKVISVVVLILIIFIFVYIKYSKNNLAPLPKVTICTMDAKLCPDGSSVGRVGPSCDFASCPIVEKSKTLINNSSGILNGFVTIGPVCPKDNSAGFSCVPTAEMYASAQVFIYKMDKTTLVKTIIPGSKGEFSISLPVGEYFVDMIHQKMGGTTGVPTVIKISPSSPLTLRLHVDTGLR